MTLSQTNSATATAVRQEQAYLDTLYRLLDYARERTERALTQTHRRGAPGGTFQARVEREVTAAEQDRRLAQLNAVEHGLCFGRTDAEPTPERAGTLYIGRIVKGLSRGLSTGARPPLSPFTRPPRKTRMVSSGAATFTPRIAPSPASMTRSSTLSGCRNRTGKACRARPC
jgi:hypothetical protein